VPLLQWEDLQKGPTRSSQESEGDIRLILTTSRRPATKSRKLCMELQCVIPSSVYVLRGKKSIRELISLSVEKGADRILIVTSYKYEPRFLVVYSEWDYLGKISGTFILRRELNIPKMAPVEGDVPFLLRSSQNDAGTIARLFGVQLCDNVCADHTFMTYTNGFIDFYRLDVSDQYVGPRIQVEAVHEGHH